MLIRANVNAEPSPQIPRQRHGPAKTGHAHAARNAKGDRKHCAVRNPVLKDKMRHQRDEHRREIHEDACRRNGHHIDRVVVAEREHTLPENTDGGKQQKILFADFELAEVAERGTEKAECRHGAADRQNTHRAQPRSGQRAGEKAGQSEKHAGQHGGDSVAIHSISPLVILEFRLIL